MTKKNRRCPICNHKKSKKIYIQKFANNLQYAISHCEKCKFVFVSNAPDQKFYNLYYKNMSKYEHERDELLHDKYCDIISSYCKKDVKILDIGCSTGNLLYQLKKRGFKDIYGIDPSPKCKALAYKKFRISIGADNIFSFKGKEKYDLLIFAAVFEHLEQVNRVVEKAQRLLSKDGLIFISVPDAGEFSKNFEEPFGEFSVEHINFFSTRDLYNLLTDFVPLYLESDGKVIYSLWKKDSQTSKFIEDYVKKSKKKQLIINKTIRSCPNKILVWGAGSLTQRLLVTTSLKTKVIKLVDRDENLIGKTLNGVPIISPQEVKQFKNPILISSFRFKEDIKKDMEKMGFKNKIITF